MRAVAHGVAMTRTRALPADPSVATYTSSFLRVYDPVVLGLSNRLLWRCPRRVLLDHYDKHVAARHLDVGPGTGWFLDHAAFATPAPDITLLDASAAVLAHAGRRIERYHPTPVQADLRDEFNMAVEPFDSIALSYVLHCLAMPLEDKAAVLGRLRGLLVPGGVLFGASILARGARHTRLSRAVQTVYNRRGIFDNADDDLDWLRSVLADIFDDSEVSVRGAVALFAGQVA